MNTLELDSDTEAKSESTSEATQPNGNSEAVNEGVVMDLTIDDFLPRFTEKVATVDELNAFFNSSKIKQELHWFTHRDTLIRAFERDDRELFYIRPKQNIVAGSMVWCTSRVLETEQAQIRLIATRPGHRGHGFARMLVDACVSFAQTHDQTEMIADVAQEAPATQFWNACGFTQSDRYETDGGRTMLRMRRDI